MRGSESPRPTGGLLMSTRATWPRHADLRTFLNFSASRVAARALLSNTLKRRRRARLSGWFLRCLAQCPARPALIAAYHLGYHRRAVQITKQERQAFFGMRRMAMQAYTRYEPRCGSGVLPGERSNRILP